MTAIRKALVYLLLTAGGLFVGLMLSGGYIDYRVTFDGVPADKLTPAQIEQMSRPPYAVMEERTSVVLNGRRILTVDGSWLMWAVVGVPILIGGVLAFVLNNWLFNKARRPSNRATAET